MNKWYDILPMSQVDHRLFVSGMAQAAHLADENPHQITAVLCVHQTMPYHQVPGVVYMHIPFRDGEEIPERQFIECMLWLKFMFQNGNTILIHCAAGISRSVTICASFMHYMGISDFGSALDRIKMARPVASPSPDVVRSAKRMLGVYPYDGSFEDAPEHQKIIHMTVEAVSAARAAAWHTDPECPMRQFLLSAQNQTTMGMARHEIPCTCSILATPEDRKGGETIIVGVPVFCSNCSKPPLECMCFDGFQ
jgi:hypothetical protein